MSEPANTPAEAPSPAPAVVAAPVPVVATPPAESIFTAAELAAIEAANTGTLKAEPTPGDYAPAAGVDPAAVIAPAPAAAAPAEPAPAPAAPAKPADDADPLESITQIRVKPKNFQEMEVLRLMRPHEGKPGLSLPDAYAQIYGAPPASAALASAPAPAAPAAPTPDPITAIDAEIARLTADADKAAEDMNMKEANRLNREIDAKARQRDRIENERAAQAKAAEAAKATEAETNFRQKEIQSAQKVYASDPELAQKGTARRQEFDAFVQIWATDPDNAALVSSPRWSEFAHRDFVEAKGPGKAIAPAAVPALPAPTPGAPAAPRVTAATALTPGSTPGGAPAPTPAQLLASLDEMSVDQLRSLLR